MGLRGSRNRLYQIAITEKFLAKCLGGRAEPIGSAANGTPGQLEEFEPVG